MVTRLILILALAVIVAYALRRKPDGRRDWYEPYDEAWFA